MRLFAALLLALLSFPAWAATLVPSNGVISTAGEYYLSANRSSAATTNIQITANNVDLNLSGKAVACTPAAPATAVTFGVKVSGGNVTIRNGGITGCFMGVHASGSPGNVTVEHVDFSGNTYIGVNGGTTFIGNVFDDIAGYQTEPYAIGINAPASGCRVFGNTFRNFHRQPISDPIKIGEGVGVLLSAGSVNCTIEANWFENDLLGSERDIAVWVASGVTATMRDNSFTNLDWTVAVAASGTAIVTDNRFWMRLAVAASSALSAPGLGAAATASGNVILGYDTPFVGAVTDGGGNIVTP